MVLGHVDPSEGRELEKNKVKVRELCEEMVRKGHAPHLQLDNITAAQLAMETLLSLTSKKAGEWFKEELRELGGLDHIIQTVTACITAITPASLDDMSQWRWDKTRLVSLKKVDRCLRVLENVTFQNEENQNYLMNFSGGILVHSTLSLLQLLSREVAAYSPPILKDSLGQLLSDTLSNLMKVVMNLTHDSTDDCIIEFFFIDIIHLYDWILIRGLVVVVVPAMGSRVYGEERLTWESVLACLLQTSVCLPEDKCFDVMTLVWRLAIV